MKKAGTLILALFMLISTACGRRNDADNSATVDLSAFYEELASEYGWEETYLVDVEGEMLESYYPGLAEIPTIQFLAKTPMMTSVVNELVLIQCETESDAANAATILEDRISYQVGDENNPGGAWYPESIESWKKAQVIQNGPYVALIASAEHQNDIAARFQQQFQ